SHQHGAVIVRRQGDRVIEHVHFSSFQTQLALDSGFQPLSRIGRAVHGQRRMLAVQKHLVRQLLKCLKWLMVFLVFAV
ncbi:MAG: hypothetical protein LBC91_01920, partial [Candidatus Accumulibacter sp.]|nr:hypothetical protein [Accumulibacter sp.]